MRLQVLAVHLNHAVSVQSAALDFLTSHCWFVLNLGCNLYAQ